MCSPAQEVPPIDVTSPLRAPSQILVFSLLAIINFVHMLLTTEGVVVEWMWWCYVPIFSLWAGGSAYYLKKPKKAAAKKTEIIGGLKERTTRSKSPAKKK